MKLRRKTKSNRNTLTAAFIASAGLLSAITLTEINTSSSDSLANVSTEKPETNPHHESSSTSSATTITTATFENNASINDKQTVDENRGNYASAQARLIKSPVLMENVSVKDSSGNYRITKIVKTDYKYPHIRIVDNMTTTASGTANPIHQSFMIADHIAVKLHDGIELSQLAELAESQGYTIRSHHPQGNYALVEFPLESTDSLEKAQLFFAEHTNEVAYAEADYLRFPSSLVPNDPEFDRQGYLSFVRTQNTSPFSTLDNIGALQAWEHRTDAITDNGEDVLVGIIDTPIYIDHEDLRNNIWQNPNEVANNGIDDDNNGFIDDVFGWNFNIDSNITDAAALDYKNPHGTHVAGILGAEGNNNVGVSGVVWRVKLVTAPIFGSEISTGSEVAAATQYLTDVGVHVINASLGAKNYMQIECDAIQEASNAGVLFVAAAGNSGLDLDAPGNDEYPAECNVDNVISVGGGSTRVHDVSEVPSSNYGAEAVDIIAPWYAFNTWIWDPDFPADSYGTIEGTSMSSPMVAGAAALLMAEYPGFSHLEIKSLLLDSATRSRPIEGTNQSGMLNIARAMNHKLMTKIPEVANIVASSHDGNVPENVMDGDTETRWSAFGFGETITFELSADEMLSGVSIQWLKGDQRASKFSIESSLDGITWQQIYGGIYRDESLEQSSGAQTDLEYYPVFNVAARYVRITGYGNTTNDWNSIIEAVVHVYDSEPLAIVNLALDGLASQSTTAYEGEASRGIDGNTQGAWSGESVTHTDNAEGSWWEVALSDTRLITEIVIHNRTDNCCVNRLKNFTVEILDNNNAVIWSNFYSEPPTPKLSIPVGTSGKRVRISLDGVLSLAEVEVFGQ